MSTISYSTRGPGLPGPGDRNDSRHIGSWGWSIGIPATASILSQVAPGSLGVWIALTLAIIATIVHGHRSLQEPGSRGRDLLTSAIMYFLVGLLCAVYLAILASPYDSKLFRLQLTGLVPEDNIASFYVLLWALCIAGVPWPGRRGSDAGTEIKPAPFEPRVASVLFLLGGVGLYIALAAPRVEVFANRGQESGNGIQALLYWAAATAIAYVILTWRRTDLRLFLVAAVAYSALMVSTGNRSPLALVAIAVIYRVVSDRNRHAGLALLVGAPIGLFILSYQSTWRSLVAARLSAEPVAVLQQMFADPLATLLRFGLDTIDGYTLTQRILGSGFEARPLDPVMALLNFVPRQIWPDKPIPLGSEVGADYLGLGAGGIFMSGPGYLSLVAGSAMLGFVLFVLFIFGLRGVVRRNGIHPVVGAAATFLIARFSMAGDAFDIFLAVQVAILFYLSSWIARLRI